MRKTTAKVARIDICILKDEGGFEISDIAVDNRANMTKHLWDLVRKKDSLWVKWCHRFTINNQSLWTCKYLQNASWT